MSCRSGILRTCFFSAIFAAAAGYAGQALASDPLPGDLVAPGPNINILMLYDFFQNDNQFGGQPGNPHGPNATQSTRIAANIFVSRYLRTFNLDGYSSGVQVYLPYVAYLGNQSLGINNLGSKAPGFLPSLGPGRADLTSTKGFAQPSFGFFTFPINNPATGTYAVIGPWVDPPVSSFNKNNNLNANQNVWTFEAEFGFRTTLLGNPQGQNLSIEVWNEDYFYGNNSSSADVTPTVYGTDIPPIYRELGATNPLVHAAVARATFREQPTEEFRVYLPYEFYPPTRAYFSPGLFQTLGGKQTYQIQGNGVVNGMPVRNGMVVDSGNRTEETQLRFIIATFVSPTLQVMGVGDYDVVAHGCPYNRTLEIRLLKFF